MLYAQLADSIINIIAFVLAYGISVMITGIIAAWVIAKLGDSTAQSLGFTSLNPLVHIDFLGFLLLYLVGIGWHRQLPIDTDNLTGRFGKFRILAAFIIESIIHTLLALIGIVFLALTFGIQIFHVACPMLASYENLSHRLLMIAYPEIPSLAIVVIFIMLLMIYINTMLAALSLLFNIVRYLMNTIMQRYPNLDYYKILLIVFGTLFIMFFIAQPLRLIITKLICLAGIHISLLFRSL